MSICKKCKGNGYVKIYNMIVQCETCKSEGEIKTKPNIEELKQMVEQAGLQ